MFVETPPRIEESYSTFWINNSIPSPSPDDIEIARDKDGKRIKVNAEWSYVQKRYYIETDKELFARWKYENQDLIETHLLSHGKTTNIRTFTKYRPHYIYQTGVLTQFACDVCVDWGFM